MYAKSAFSTHFVIFHMQGTFAILCCLWHRLSILVYKTFAMIIFLSLKMFYGFFSIELLIGYLDPPVETGGAQIGKSTYAMRRGS